MHLSEVPRQQAITSRTQLVKGIMQRCNDCIGHKKVMMSGRVLFRHPQSVIVSYWCMRHNAKLGDHVTRSCSRTSATSNHTQDHRLAGLYRRRDEPLGAGFCCTGAHWAVQQRAALGSASATRCKRSSVHGDGRLRPHPPIPNRQVKGKSRPNTNRHSKNDSERKRIQKRGWK